MKQMIKHTLRAKELLSVIVFSATCGASYAFKETIEHKVKSIYIRAGIAGALTNTAVEVVLYSFDTLNMVSKAKHIPDEAKVKTSLINKMRIYVKKVTLTKFLARYLQGVHYVSLGYTLCLSVYYILYYKTSEKLEKGKRMSVLWANLLAAGISEFIFIFFFYPFELIKTRKQVAMPSETNKISLLHAFKGDSMQSILRNLKGLYTGCPQFLLTYVIYIAIEFGIYKFLMNRYHERKSKKNFYYSAIIGSAAMSALIGSVVTNPLEVWTVIRQVNKEKLTLTGLIKQPKLWWKGILWRTFYNTATSCMLFIGLEYSFKLLGINFSL
jgi:hypothetical protein